MRVKSFILVLTISVLTFFVVAEGSAQMMGGRGGWGMGGAYGRMYDRATTETVSGVVEDVGQIVPLTGMSQGIHLILKEADGEMISVHLGPAWFILNQEIQIEPGDKVEVKGSRVTFEGEPAIIARQVRKDDDALILRDDYGYPVWSGWRRRIN